MAVSTTMILVISVGSLGDKEKARLEFVAQRKFVAWHSISLAQHCFVAQT